MTRLLVLTVLWISLLCSNAVQAQSVHYTLPESCVDAPFFCNDYLINLSSNNVNGAPNNLAGLTGCAMENTVWLSFTTCSDAVALQFLVDSCALGSGLEFSLFSTPDCADFTLVGNPCNTIINGASSTINFNSLTSGATYHLAIDGISGDECRFEVQSLTGIYTAPPAHDNSTPGYLYTIETPAELICIDNGNCPGGIFQLIPAICSADTCNNPWMNPFPFDTCAVQFDICRPDSGTIVYSPQLWDTIVQWNIPDCAIVTGDTTGYVLDIDLDPCLEDYVNNLNPFPPNPFTGNPFDSISFEVTATEVLVPINTPVPIDTITDQGVDIYCNCPPVVIASDCNDCLSGDTKTTVTPVNFFLEEHEVCPGECVSTSAGELCAGDSEITIDGCIDITLILVEETQPDDMFFSDILCDGDCFFYDSFVFCSPGTHSFTTVDANGCEIQVTVDLFYEYLPTIDFVDGNGVIDCYGCVSLSGSATNATTVSWGGQGGNTTVACSPGLYIFTATNSCGEVSASVSVDEDTQPPTIEMDATIIVLDINNPISTITAMVTGGSNSVYQWSGPTGNINDSDNQIDVSEPGIYFVTVTNNNNGCYTVATIEIFLNSTPVVPIIALGDSCEVAPLFCAEFLDGLQTNNENGTIDDFSSDVGCSTENGVWLKFMACEDFAELSFDVDSCTQAEGLEFSLLSSMDCDTFTVVSSCEIVSDNSSANIIFDSLTAGTMYYLLIDGINGDICNLEVGVISGVVNSSYGDTINPTDTIQYRLEQLAPGSIAGPTEICAGAPTTYTFIPGTCQIVEGDCNRSSSSTSGARADICDLPFDLCFDNYLGLDTIVDWDIPTGITIIGDSTDFDITIEVGIDFILDYYNGMVPASDTDTIVVTLYADYDIVPITDTLTGDTTGLVYCYCPSNGIICGSCNTGASLDVSIIIIFDNQTIIACNLPQDQPPYTLESCVFTTWTYIQEPMMVDSYTDTVCPGECSNTPYGLFCAGSYNVQITDCFTVEIDIIEEPETNITYTDQIICEGECVSVGSMVFCSPGLQTWSENSGGCITNYSVLLIESTTSPIDFGTEVICAGDCFEIHGNIFCEEGTEEFQATNADGCIVDATITIEFETAALSVSPATEICVVANDAYNVTFFISGDAPFSVNGMEITGSTFTSQDILSGEPYYFEVKNTTAACPDSIIVEGIFYCPLLACDSDPGILATQRQDVCVINPVIITELTPVFLENSDITSEYVIYTGADPLVGNILMRNSTGEFYYEPNLLSTQTDYSTARLVGEKNGYQVDLNASCLKYTDGPKVAFYSEPEVTLTPSEQLVINCIDTELSILSNIVGGSGQWLIEWTGNVNSANAPDVLITEGGAYAIKVTDQLTGCDAISTIDVMEDLEAPDFQITVPNEMLNCEIDEISIEVNLLSNLTNPSFSWQGPGGQLPLGGTPLNIDVQDAGWYALNITNEDNGCSTLDSVEVLVNENLPFAFILEVEHPICMEDQTGSLQVISVEGGTPPYDYTIDGFTTTPVIPNLEPGIYDLEITDVYGCKLLETIEINEPTNLSSELDAEIIIEYGEAVNLNPRLNFSPYSVSWTDSEGTILATTESYSFMAQIDSKIFLTATNDIGCEIQKAIQIRVKAIESALFIPSAFSPNGDEFNEFFEVFSNDKVVQVNEIVIFDRWGNLVFQAQNYMPGSEEGRWDGKMKGKKLNAGVFVFKVDYTLIDGKTKSETGDVLLIN